MINKEEIIISNKCMRCKKPITREYNYKRDHDPLPLKYCRICYFKDELEFRLSHRFMVCSRLRTNVTYLIRESHHKIKDLSFYPKSCKFIK